MSRRLGAGLAALVLVVGAPASAAGSGPTTTDPSAQKSKVDQERNRLAEQYDETLSAEAGLVAAFEQSKAKAAQLDQQIATLDASILSVQQEVDAATAAATKALIKRDALRGEVRAATAELQRRRGALRATAVSGYVWFGERGSVHSAYGEALGSDIELVSGFYAGYLNDVQAQRIHAVEAQREKVEHLTDDADAASDAAESARGAVAARRAELQTVREQQAAAKAQADAEVEHQRQLVAEVEAKRAEYQQRLQSLQAESARLGDLLRSRQAAAATPASAQPASAPRPSGTPAPKPSTAAPVSTKPPSRPAPSPAAAPSPNTTNNAGAGAPPGTGVTLSYPLPGYPIVSTYGWRVHPILGVRKLHEGIDIWAPSGTPIHAAGSGVVVWAGPRNGYGNAVIIDHGSGVGTVYAHQSSVAVSPGQSVSRGEVIGYVGQTGLAAGPHLHFEVRVGGRTYDPLAYVRPG